MLTHPRPEERWDRGWNPGSLAPGPVFCNTWALLMNRTTQLLYTEKVASESI